MLCRGADGRASPQWRVSKTSTLPVSKMYFLSEASGFWCFNVCKTVTLHALQGLNWPSTAMGDWSLASFFPCQGQVCLCLFLKAVLLRWDLKRSSSMVARVAGCRLTQRVTGRSGPLARGCDQGFSVGVVCWVEPDLEGGGFEWKADARMISRVWKLAGGNCCGRCQCLGAGATDRVWNQGISR